MRIAPMVMLLCAASCGVRMPPSVPTGELASVPVDTAADAGSLEDPRPVHPFAPKSVWSQGHGTWCQQTSYGPGPRAEQTLVADVTRFDGHLGWFPTGTIFGAEAPDGRYVFWGSQGAVVYKAIVSRESVTVRVVDPRQAGLDQPTGYWVVDRQNRVYVPDLRGRDIVVFEDADPNDLASPLVVRTRRAVPEALFASPKDFVKGIKLLWTGELLLTMKEAGRAFMMDRERLEVLSVVELGAPADNNPCVDETNAIYVTTTSSLERLQWNGSALTRTWSVPITGSGSTPTLMGASGREDAFIVITDRQQPMNLVLIWRDDIPANWAGLPGLPTRIAAVAPVTFGSADPAWSPPSENSVLVQGSAAVVSTWNGLWPRFKSPNPGVQRIDWDPMSRTLVTRWINTEVYLPNSMLASSVATGLLYAVGQQTVNDSAMWGVELIDFDTGALRRFLPLGPANDTSLNIVGSGVHLGPHGDLVTMSPTAVIRVRSVP